MFQNIQTHGPVDRSQRLLWAYGFSSFQGKRGAKTRHGRIWQILSGREVLSGEEW